MGSGLLLGGSIGGTATPLLAWLLLGLRGKLRLKRGSIIDGVHMAGVMDLHPCLWGRRDRANLPFAIYIVT